MRAQFFLNGDATPLNDTCFQLTRDELFSSGSIWEANKIDLRRSFDLIVEVNLGSRDADGADGIVLGIQPVSTSVGQAGEGIGFQGVRPSLGVEMDTWQNTNLSDPAYDHMAIVRNGDMNHASANTLAGPVQISASSSNVEDGRYHQLRIIWDAEAMILETFFDCEARLTYAGDMVDDIFGGDPLVFWGVTSATGGAYNAHQVCFTYTTFLDQIPDVTMCPGGQVSLRARGGSTYSWEPAVGLSDPNIPNPVASPEQTTEYVVTIQDDCGRAVQDSVTVFVVGNPIQLDLGPDRTVCETDSVLLDATTTSAEYLWNDGSTEARRAIRAPGTYSVTVSRTDIYCTSDDEITIATVPRPEIAFPAPDTVGCPGQEVVLRPSFRGGIPLWPDGSSRDTFPVQRSSRVSASVSNLCGSAADFILVSFDPCDELYVPTAFSPNGDGQNDRFTLYSGGDVVEVLRFEIYSRWGQRLFMAAGFLPGDGAPAWDGRFLSRPMPVDTYLYQAEVRFRDGTTDLRSGEFVLLR